MDYKLNCEPNKHFLAYVTFCWITHNRSKARSPALSMADFLPAQFSFLAQVILPQRNPPWPTHPTQISSYQLFHCCHPTYHFLITSYLFVNYLPAPDNNLSADEGSLLHQCCFSELKNSARESWASSQEFFFFVFSNSTLSFTLSSHRVGTVWQIERWLAQSSCLGTCRLCLTHPATARMPLKLSLGLYFLHSIPEEVPVTSPEFSCRLNCVSKITQHEYKVG